MKNYLLSLGLCASLVCPSIYASVSKTPMEVPALALSAKLPSIEASSLSALDEKDLEDRISRLPLPDNVIPIRATTPYPLRKDPLFPTPERQKMYKDNEKNRLPLPTLRLKEDYKK